MATKDPRVDAYIAKAPAYAKPILKSIRQTMHANCPDLEETLKWSTPTFMYAGSILAGMAAFKERVHFHFWKGALITDANGVSVNDALDTITDVSDLPPKSKFARYIRAGMKLNEEGVRLPKRPAKAKPPLTVPDDLQKALKKNRTAAANFEKLSPSHKREYVEWITEAKRPETRAKRIATTIEWITEGKARNWKYM